VIRFLYKEFKELKEEIQCLIMRMFSYEANVWKVLRQKLFLLLEWYKLIFNLGMVLANINYDSIHDIKLLIELLNQSRLYNYFVSVVFVVTELVNDVLAHNNWLS
jgi:hypothetical protein